TPTGYNGTFTVVSAADATHFTYTTSGSGIGAGTVFGLANGPSATITTSSPHGFTVGQVVTLSGMTPAAYNCAFPTTPVTPTSFPYKPPSPPLAAGTAFGTASVPVYPGPPSLPHNKTDGVPPPTNAALGLPGTGAPLTDTAGELFVSNPANLFDTASTL